MRKLSLLLACVGCLAAGWSLGQFHNQSREADAYMRGLSRGFDRADVFNLSQPHDCYTWRDLDHVFWFQLEDDRTKENLNQQEITKLRLRRAIQLEAKRQGQTVPQKQPDRPATFPFQPSH